MTLPDWIHEIDCMEDFVEEEHVRRLLAHVRELRESLGNARDGCNAALCTDNEWWKDAAGAAEAAADLLARQEPPELDGALEDAEDE